MEAKMKDCLQDRNTGKVVEGNKKYKIVETVMVFYTGKWGMEGFRHRRRRNVISSRQAEEGITRHRINCSFRFESLAKTFTGRS
jgi:hypothetical protein